MWSKFFISVYQIFLKSLSNEVTNTSMQPSMRQQYLSFIFPIVLSLLLCILFFISTSSEIYIYIYTDSSREYKYTLLMNLWTLSILLTLMSLMLHKFDTLMTLNKLFEAYFIGENGCHSFWNIWIHRCSNVNLISAVSIYCSLSFCWVLIVD